MEMPLGNGATPTKLEGAEQPTSKFGRCPLTVIPDPAPITLQGCVSFQEGTLLMSMLCLLTVVSLNVIRK